MLEDEASSDESVKRRRRAEVDASDDEHDGIVEDERPDGDFESGMHSSKPATAEESVVARK